jgi:hypothetical protein
MPLDKEIEILDALIDKLNQISNKNSKQDTGAKKQDNGKFTPIPLPDVATNFDKDKQVKS